MLPWKLYHEREERQSVWVGESISEGDCTRQSVAGGSAAKRVSSNNPVRSELKRGNALKFNYQIVKLLFCPRSVLLSPKSRGKTQRNAISTTSLLD